MCGVVKGLGAHRHAPPNTALRQSAGPPCHSERSEESRSVLGSRRGIQLSSFPCRRRLRSFQSPFLASIISSQIGRFYDDPISAGFNDLPRNLQQLDYSFPLAAAFAASGALGFALAAGG